MSTNESPVSTSSYSQVYETLLELIMDFKLKPFALISEKALADFLQVSRSPVREALARLSTIGMVDIYAQRGTIVSPLRLEDLQHSQFLRECVEVGLLTKVCQLSDRNALVKRLTDEISLQETLAGITDYKRFARSDELFHQYIASAASFTGIWSEISTAKLHMNRFRKLTYPDMDSLGVIIAQHRAIAEAIKAGNTTKATKAMQKHLRKIFPLIPDLMSKFPQYFEKKKSDSSRFIHRPDLVSLNNPDQR